MVRRWLTALLLIPAILVFFACTATPKEKTAGQAVYVDDVILRGYRPASTLVTPETRVERAKFSAVDIHCHWNKSVEPSLLLSAMDKLNVGYAVNLSGGHGDDLMHMLDRYVKPSGGRLVIFANVDFSKIDEPGFGDTAAAALEKAHARGASGLKIFKNLGLTVRDKSGKVVPVDDPRIDPIWHMCAKLNMPVLIHSADPIAFFRPTDERNERWMQLQRHPNWSFYGPKYPAWKEVIAQRNRMIAKHRGTTFIVAHMAEAANDYTMLGRWLDEHPNMYVDISGRMNEIGRQPYASRRFIIQYADRVLFGTDRYPGRKVQPRYDVYFRMLETYDEYFDYFNHIFPPAGEWKVYGLGLPDDVLQKVYGGNAARILRLGAAKEHD